MGCDCRAGKKIRVGNKLYFGDANELVAEIIDNTTSRVRTIRFLWEDSEQTFNARLRAGVKHHCPNTT